MQVITEVTNKELKQFGLLMSAFIVLFFGLLIPWIWGLAYPEWPWFVSAALINITFLLPSLLKLIYSVWMRLAHVLGWINTRLLLSVVFYVIFLPIGLVMRLFGKDPMQRKFDEEASTYRVNSKQPSVDHMEEPF